VRLELGDLTIHRHPAVARHGLVDLPDDVPAAAPRRRVDLDVEPVAAPEAAGAVAPVEQRLALVEPDRAELALGAEVGDALRAGDQRLAASSTWEPAARPPPLARDRRRRCDRIAREVADAAPEGHDEEQRAQGLAQRIGRGRGGDGSPVGMQLLLRVERQPEELGGGRVRESSLERLRVPHVTAEVLGVERELLLGRPRVGELLERGEKPLPHALGVPRQRVGRDDRVPQAGRQRRVPPVDRVAQPFLVAQRAEESLLRDPEGRVESMAPPRDDGRRHEARLPAAVTAGEVHLGNRLRRRR
jgi:hypothetical protein